MLSLVLYGRNDNYGYNLHKRAALSLNCMAEVLTGKTDEIIFVDYNTPDDFPTFPEALADTLTGKARSLLRILRVRPEIHRQRFESRTHLKAVESVSRNVAIRRSNPANRWILSTNTDMIFVPRRGSSLTEAVAPFGDAFYCAPRFEIPETLWEGYDRLDPAGVIAETRHWGSAAHLDEIVYGSETILYDGPGDFQLVLRKDLFEIDGFHEGMLLGWHLDSNVSKRLGLLYGSVGDAAPALFGYHCDHTRQVTPMHAHRSPENDTTIYVDQVSVPRLPEQSASWGLVGCELEEIRLDSRLNGSYRSAIRSAIGEGLSEPTNERYQSATYDKTSVSPEHVLPFLLDLFSNAPRQEVTLWSRPLDRLFELFCKCRQELGFPRAVLVYNDGGILNPEVSSFVFNFGVPVIASGSEADDLVVKFWELLAHEARHQKMGRSPRRFIGVNTVHNRFERLMLQTVGCARTPFSTRLRHGYALSEALSPAPSVEWIESMSVGSAGIRDGSSIRMKSGATGHFAYGPYATLRAGRYRGTLSFRHPPRKRRWWAFRPEAKVGVVMVVELVLDEKTRTTCELALSDLKENTFALEFDITRSDVTKQIQFRLTKLLEIAIELNSVKIDVLD